MIYIDSTTISYSYRIHFREYCEKTPCLDKAFQLILRLYGNDINFKNAWFGHQMTMNGHSNIYTS